MAADPEIQTVIKTQFPIVFGNQPAVPHDVFMKGYNLLVDYGMKAAEPQLNQETSKYQWTLLSTSLILLVIVLFNVGNIKIDEVTITVNRTTLLWYLSFVIAVLLIFLARAALDLKRASLARRKDSNVASELQALVNVGWSKRMLEVYFWQELFHQIGEKYVIYEKARSHNGEPIFKNIDIRAVKIDLDKMRNIEDFRELVEGHEGFLKSILERLDKDVSCFVDGVEEYDHLHSPSQLDQGDIKLRRPLAISELFDAHLRPWFDARNNMASEHLESQLEGKKQLQEQLMLEAQLDVLRETVQIRRLYVFIELGLPTAFACSVLIYVWYSMPK